MQLVTRIYTVMCAFAAIGQVCAAPVVYKVTTVASGRLGETTFTNARLTISLSSDTLHVQTDKVNRAVVYNNGYGTATLALTQTDGTRLRALLRRGEIYARYDTQLGLVGFASSLGTAYPIVVGCVDPMTCSEIGTNDGIGLNAHFNGLATTLADIAQYPQDSYYVSHETLSLATDLSDSTLLSGWAHSCSVAIPLYVCPSAPTEPLHTDHGDLYLMDPAVDGASGIFTVTVGADD